MPSDQAMEKSDLLLKLGAIVERVPPVSIVDPEHYVNRAKRLAAEHTEDPDRPGRGYFADQFENQANWQAHFNGTGPEIFQQCSGRIDAFVAGSGTGGTIAGVAKFLKSKLANIKIVLADPQGSGLYNKVKHGVMFDTKEREGTRRRHQVDSIVEGIGLTRVTANFDVACGLIDDAVRVKDEQALGMAKWLVERDGLFVGSSSTINCEKLQYLSCPPLTDPNRCCSVDSCEETGTRTSRCDHSLRLWHTPSFKILETGWRRWFWSQDQSLGYHKLSRLAIGRMLGHHRSLLTAQCHVR